MYPEKIFINKTNVYILKQMIDDGTIKNDVIVFLSQEDFQKFDYQMKLSNQNNNEGQNQTLMDIYEDEQDMMGNQTLVDITQMNDDQQPELKDQNLHLSFETNALQSTHFTLNQRNQQRQNNNEGQNQTLMDIYEDEQDMMGNQTLVNITQINDDQLHELKHQNLHLSFESNALQSTHNTLNQRNQQRQEINQQNLSNNYEQIINAQDYSINFLQDSLIYQNDSQINFDINSQSKELDLNQTLNLNITLIDKDIICEVIFKDQILFEALNIKGSIIYEFLQKIDGNLQPQFQDNKISVKVRNIEQNQQVKDVLNKIQQSYHVNFVYFQQDYKSYKSFSESKYIKQILEINNIKISFEKNHQQDGNTNYKIYLISLKNQGLIASQFQKSYKGFRMLFWSLNIRDKKIDKDNYYKLNLTKMRSLFYDQYLTKDLEQYKFVVNQEIQSKDKCDECFLIEIDTNFIKDGVQKIYINNTIADYIKASMDSMVYFIIRFNVQDQNPINNQELLDLIKFIESQKLKLITKVNNSENQIDLNIFGPPGEIIELFKNKLEPKIELKSSLLINTCILISQSNFKIQKQNNPHEQVIQFPMEEFQSFIQKLENTNQVLIDVQGPLYYFKPAQGKGKLKNYAIIINILMEQKIKLNISTQKSIQDLKKILTNSNPIYRDINGLWSNILTRSSPTQLFNQHEILQHTELIQTQQLIIQPIYEEESKQQNPQINEVSIYKSDNPIINKLRVTEYEYFQKHFKFTMNYNDQNLIKFLLPNLNQDYIQHYQELKLNNNEASDRIFYIGNAELIKSLKQFSSVLQFDRNFEEAFQRFRKKNSDEFMVICTYITEFLDKSDKPQVVKMKKDNCVLPNFILKK